MTSGSPIGQNDLDRLKFEFSGAKKFPQPCLEIKKCDDNPRKVLLKLQFPLTVKSPETMDQSLVYDILQRVFSNKPNINVRKFQVTPRVPSKCH